MHMLTCHSQCFPVQLHPTPRPSGYSRREERAARLLKPSTLVHWANACNRDGKEIGPQPSAWTNREIQNKLSKHTRTSILDLFCWQIFLRDISDMRSTGAKRSQESREHLSLHDTPLHTKLQNMPGHKTHHCQHYELQCANYHGLPIVKFRQILLSVNQNKSYDKERLTMQS